jgi:hypothetical protein
VLAFCAYSPKGDDAQDPRSISNNKLDLLNKEATFGTFFRPGKILRGFYNSSLNALIQHYSWGSYKYAHPVPSDATLSNKLSKICG